MLLASSLTRHVTSVAVRAESHTHTHTHTHVHTPNPRKRPSHVAVNISEVENKRAIFAISLEVISSRALERVTTPITRSSRMYECLFYLGEESSSRRSLPPRRRRDENLIRFLHSCVCVCVCGAALLGTNASRKIDWDNDWTTQVKEFRVEEYKVHAVIKSRRKFIQKEKL